jgi:hypothetical protein
MAPIEIQRRQIRRANFQKRFLSLERPPPFEAMSQNGCTDAAAARGRPHGKIQDFNITGDASSDEEPNDLSVFFAYPTRHVSFRNSPVIPRGPLGDLRTCGLNCEDRIHIALLKRANKQTALQGDLNSFQ